VALGEQAKAAAKKQDYEVAIGLLKRAIALDAANVALVVDLAEAYRRAQMFAPAQKLLEDRLKAKAFARAPEQKQLKAALGDVQFYWGGSLLRESRFEEAIPHLRAAYALSLAVPRSRRAQFAFDAFLRLQSAGPLRGGASGSSAGAGTGAPGRR
jgi:tetratricopeptide (TPR) repeat protein